MAGRRHESLVPLSRDHRDALALAFRLHHPSPPGPATAMTPPSTPASRAAEVASFFTAHLDGHFRAEEDVLFPAVAASVGNADPAAALVRQLVDEHRQLEGLRDAIAAAASRSCGKTGLDEALRAFADLLELHVRREERELFVRFEDVVPASDADAIGPRIREILSSRPG
jgi:iron-sulfur cluster repair protein YtfE (RIC family)